MRGGLEQMLDDLATVDLDRCGIAAVLQNPSNQREAVGMGPGRCDADDVVADGYSRSVDESALVHDTDTKASQVVVVVCVRAGMFSGLATQQCRARELTAACDARDDACGDVDVESRRRVVVEEE